MAARRRVFAGERLRALRAQRGLSQSRMAARLGISHSYLSQIENNDRPVTGGLLARLAAEFPAEWGQQASGEESEWTEMLFAARDAGADTSIDRARLDEAQLRRAIEQQPAVVRRLVALHDAYRRTQEQLRVLDDKVESGSTAAGSLPWEEVRDWFQVEGNYIDSIDRAAEALADSLPAEQGRETALGERLQERYGVALRNMPGDGAELSRLDRNRGILWVSSALASETRLFQIAHRLARAEFADEIASVIAASGMRSDAARELLTVGLANYAAGALLMPYGAFRAEALAARHDIDRLRQRFGVSFEQACHRLSNLQRPGAAGLPFFFCRVDMAGNITKRHSATPLQFARFGGACPLWIVHEAVAIPDRILVQLAEMPDGTRYVSMAKGLVKPSGSYARPPRRYAVALGCEESHAAEFVYADGLRPGGAATPIGASCRICPRADCDQRAFPPAASIIDINPDRRSVVPYGFR